MPFLGLHAKTADIFQKKNSKKILSVVLQRNEKMSAVLGRTRF